LLGYGISIVDFANLVKLMPGVIFRKKFNRFLTVAGRERVSSAVNVQIEEYRA